VTATLDDNQVVYSFELILTRPDTELTGLLFRTLLEAQKTVHLQVALAIVTIDQNSRIVHWHEDDFYVLPSLWGSGIGGRFLHAILSDLPKRRAVQRGSVCRVELPEIRPSDPASRNDLIGIIDFYKGYNFKVIIEGGSERLLEQKLDA
jgi:GNAT superfamily N-acetyltransferase